MRLVESAINTERTGQGTACMQGDEAGGLSWPEQDLATRSQIIADRGEGRSTGGKKPIF
jgi:hypothetical protein